MAVPIWRLKSGMERRVLSGHPWVFAKDLTSSTKGILPGGPIELQDNLGRFVARGYGNAESQIAFRVLTLNSAEKEPWTLAAVLQKGLAAWKQRHLHGYRRSFRLIFSEGDGLPGLIVDRYLVARPDANVQLFAVQVLTAGIQRILMDMTGFLEALNASAQAEGYSQIPWERSAVILRNDVKIRALEGLEVEVPRFVRSLREVDFDQSDILLEAASETDENRKAGIAGEIRMSCDLYQGQKTGFFLDQTHNISVVCELLRNGVLPPRSSPIRILDLCCYVGHWSTQLAHLYRQRGMKVETTLVDVSAGALKTARVNAERAGAQVQVVMGDVLKWLPSATQQYDIVIADPPAFIKAKKDLAIGKHAYLKLNAQALRVVAPQGILVSCSCSGLLNENDFAEVLEKSIQRSGRSVKWLAKGGTAPDHPSVAGFPEGKYLKMLVHQIGANASASSGGGAIGVVGAAGAGEEF